MKYTDTMLKQFRKSMIAIFDYLPTKYKATANEWKVRKFIWAFKDGEYSSYAARLVADRLIKEYGEKTDFCFACIPASSEDKNEARYKNFSAEVCRITGACNAYPAIKVEGEKLAIHETQKGKVLKDTEIVTFDTDFFRGKDVVVFDDVITKGYSYAKFASHLEALGAHVLGGLFLAKTIIH